eukprot:scaffold381_cov168-Ochromonas_danica.AAC.29
MGPTIDPMQRLEDVLRDEIIKLPGVRNVQVAKGGVHFEGTEETGYAGLLWLRSSQRLMEKVGESGRGEAVRHREDVYAFVAQFAWDMMIDPHVHSIKCDCVIGRDVAKDISHTHFTSLTMKNAIIDKFRDQCGVRPSVDTSQPTLLLLLYLHRDRATLYRVWSGESSMHKRGYRSNSAIHKAALRETSAAALLLNSKWQSAEGLCDPMCGSGTFAVEAALIAANTAPGLIRYPEPLNEDIDIKDRLPSPGQWLDLSVDQWHKSYAQAQALDNRNELNRADRPPTIFANDINVGAMKLAVDSAVKAKVHRMIQFTNNDIAHLPGTIDLRKIQTVITNPPWDVRLHDGDEAWRLLDDFLVEVAQAGGKNAWLLSGSKELSRSIHHHCRSSHNVKLGDLSLIFSEYALDRRPQTKFHSEVMTRSQVSGVTARENSM